jgi:hypothetical protein
LEAAKEQLKQQPESYQQILLLMHSVMAFMQFDIGKGFDIISLAIELKKLLG